ncbi:MAG TPA: PIG-L family deacetylase [Flavisolibacter sp.]|nr:PIG-L family deacetylase [Flavisolibacter sp.]
MKKFLLLITFSTFVTLSFSQTSADIFLGLKKLNVLGRVLYVAAHPDDENTRLLTYFSKDRLYRTGYLSMTRGDGGQNLIGDEQGIALGMIRTQELLSARRIDGAEQFFTRAYDFGFSKTPEETFAKWDREKILSDVVWIIRQFQPDVIITRFPTTGEGGHGHHTASAILANEAFTAAADPKRFPEQLRFVQTWQAKRILFNGFNFGGQNTITGDQLRLDVGGYNPILGKSYGEIAAESRSQHKSQGFGSARSRGEALEYFRTTGGSAPTKDLFEDVDVSWKRVNGGEKVQKLIDDAMASFDFSAPQKSLPALVKIYNAIGGISDRYWREQKQAEVKSLIEQASGLWMECFTNENYIAQGDSLRLNFSINDRLGIGAKLEFVRVENFDSSFRVTLVPNRNVNFTKTIKAAPSMPVSQPYWLQKRMEEGHFNVSNQQLIGQPDIEPSFKALFDLTIAGQEFFFEKIVKYKYVDQVRGEQNQPVTVVPRALVYTNPELVLLKKTENEKKSFTVQIVANTNIDYKKEQVYAEIGTKDVVSLKDSNGRVAKNATQQFQVSVDPKSIDDIEKVIPSVRFDSSALNYMALATVKYEHIPFINYFYTDWVKLVPIDLKIYNKRIGYIVGAGDKIPEALEEMGYDVTLLTEKELARNNLQQYDAIITGVRAFNTNDWMNKYYDKLMKYVENGGNYIVQYSQANNIRGKMGPYNFSVVNKRITDENAAVTFLKPEHPVLNFPNKITQEDFKDWVQERSIYHADRFDSNFQTILRMNDPGEQPDDGALVIAKYGKGYFTYTGLVFFRELPSGVPGAYRLLANIIALNRKKEL